MTSITIETVGRRHYLVGNTYALRDRLRGAGAHFDGARRAWWTGKREIAEQIAAIEVPPDSSPRNGHAHSDQLDATSEIVGKASYKGRPYLLVWMGDTRRGPAAKLAFRDGSKVFWADASAVTVTKRYREPLTFGKLERLREEYRDAHDKGLTHPEGRRYECDECGEWVTSGDGSSCWETGAAHGCHPPNLSASTIGPSAGWSASNATDCRTLNARCAIGQESIPTISCATSSSVSLTGMRSDHKHGGTTNDRETRGARR